MPRVHGKIFNQYRGFRSIRVHGAEGGKIEANAGLMAGCAFAKDVLKSFLNPMQEIERNGEIRDYVDDITIANRGADEKQTTR